METIYSWIETLNSLVWGPYMIVLILGTGLFLTIGLYFLQVRKLGLAFKLLFTKSSDTHGEIQPFKALMTALSATVGTGNIAGVATAIAIGGPGSIFWMWCAAFVGMATKYAEAVLAVKYREIDELGRYVGGPMYYLKNGLSKKFAWLAVLFAFFGSIAGFGIGNMVQSNSIADVLEGHFAISPILTGIIIMILAGLVILGGIKRIANVASAIVPSMVIVYVLSCLIALILNFNLLPSAFKLIFTYAFNPIAATGGFVGSTIILALQMGVSRGIFSNEAGLGSAAIAHAAAKTDSPVRQGLIAMLGTFIDSIIICTMTALVIIISGVWETGESGAVLTSESMEHLIPYIGHFIVIFSLIFFAFTTIIGWSYYSERCVEFLFGVKAIKPFRLIWVIAILIGASIKMEFIWLLTDTLNGLMAIPNLIGLLLLSPVIFKLSKTHSFKKVK
ncbi:sodium:alanine symporter family protein [Thiotrichales bacterium 19S9-12]|nr:sodium:alanine symporter family protein [Thiotrichales bacterium 19S9-11]MCF6811690.1 sodium:alanine symporter family protein [Thiotrichales bacterium 19S9-12]